MNVYRVEVVRLRDRNADKVFEKLRRKINRGKILRRHDVFPPLLSHPHSISATPELSPRLNQAVELHQGRA